MGAWRQLGKLILGWGGINFMVDSGLGRRETVQFVGLTQRPDLEGGERWFAARTLPYRESSAHLNVHRLGGTNGFSPPIPLACA
jgi:hypothetical protein